jgi:hypothetical protein
MATMCPVIRMIETQLAIDYCSCRAKYSDLLNYICSHFKRFSSGGNPIERYSSWRPENGAFGEANHITGTRVAGVVPRGSMDEQVSRDCTVSVDFGTVLIRKIYYTCYFQGHTRNKASRVPYYKAIQGTRLHGYRTI